jgi:carotenoid cleavage dioxygenase
MDITSSAYLQGNWGPVHDELDAADLKVTGELPRDLAGTFLRIGPNTQFPPIGRYHYFDGDGMVHAVRIAEGRASYKNRWVRTKGFELEREAGRALWTGFAEPPNLENPPHGMMYKNVANTAFVEHQRRLLALWEGGAPHELRLTDLATVGAIDFDGRLEGPFTAHPKVDPATGEMMFFGYHLWMPVIKYGVIAPSGKIAHYVDIPLEVPVMMHDFAVTEHYTIILDLPLTFRMERIEQGKPPLGFEQERPSRFGILPRHGDASLIRWFELPPCFIFHVFNAYEEGSSVVLVASRASGADVMGSAEAGTFEDEGARTTRFTFNLETGAAREERLDDAPADFPRIDDRHAGRKTRHGHAVRFLANAKLPYADAVIRYDFDRNRSETHVFGPNRFGGEMVFAPRVGKTADDDGYLLGFVHDEGTGQSELLVLDAREVSRGPVARVAMPRRVPYGFHSHWTAATG